MAREISDFDHRRMAPLLLIAEGSCRYPSTAPGAQLRYTVAYV